MSRVEEWVVATADDRSRAYEDSDDDCDYDDDDGGSGGGDDGDRSIPEDVLEERLNYLMKLIDDEIYLLQSGSCSEDEPGILKLKLNPFKVERSCRFYRRFGSDSFLSLTLPAPSRAPRHLRLRAKTNLREDIATWLTLYEHRLLGRLSRPFYVEEVKARSSNKLGAPKLRVEFFTVDGVDFDHDIVPAPLVSPPKQESSNHTPMTLEALVNWHMSLDVNQDQPSCKLFQRIQLGLSRTFATVRLKHTASSSPARHDWSSSCNERWMCFDVEKHGERDLLCPGDLWKHA